MKKYIIIENKEKTYKVEYPFDDDYTNDFTNVLSKLTHEYNIKINIDDIITFENK